MSRKYLNSWRHHCKTTKILQTIFVTFYRAGLLGTLSVFHFTLVQYKIYMPSYCIWVDCENFLIKERLIQLWSEYSQFTTHKNIRKYSEKPFPSASAYAYYLSIVIVAYHLGKCSMNYSFNRKGRELFEFARQKM